MAAFGVFALTKSVAPVKYVSKVAEHRMAFAYDSKATAKASTSTVVNQSSGLAATQIKGQLSSSSIAKDQVAAADSNATTDQLCPKPRGTMRMPCITRDLTTFRLGATLIHGQNISCTANTIRVDFQPIQVIRDAHTGGAGTAQVQVEYSDGTKSDIMTVNFPRVTGNVQIISGVYHVFNYGPGNAPNNLSFRLLVLSPYAEHVTDDWATITDMIAINAEQGARRNLCYVATYLHNGMPIIFNGKPLDQAPVEH